MSLNERCAEKSWLKQPEERNRERKVTRQRTEYCFCGFSVCTHCVFHWIMVELNSHSHNWGWYLSVALCTVSHNGEILRQCVWDQNGPYPTQLLKILLNCLDEKESKNETRSRNTKRISCTNAPLNVAWRMCASRKQMARPAKKNGLNKTNKCYYVTYTHLRTHKRHQLESTLKMCSVAAINFIYTYRNIYGEIHLSCLLIGERKRKKNGIANIGISVFVRACGKAVQHNCVIAHIFLCAGGLNAEKLSFTLTINIMWLGLDRAGKMDIPNKRRKQRTNAL